MSKSRLPVESNTYASDVLLNANNAVALEYGVHAALEPIPTYLYPDNPAQKPVLPAVDSTYAQAAFFLNIFLPPN